MSLALLFPGQGSQSVGMGRALADAHPVAAATFAEADRILGDSLSTLMWGGPEDDLVLTQNAQPALLTHSVAVLRVVQDRLGEVAMAAGHSLGEFSAHVAAGTLSFPDALRAVRLRGELMASAGALRPGGMAAVLGMEDDAVEALCREVATASGATVVPANFNSPGQVVISGDRSAVAKAVELGPERGAKKVVLLNVSGAFHSPLMEPAERGLREWLDAVNFGRLRYPVYSNVTAEPVLEEEARGLLVRQLISPVRWASSIRAMVGAGADRFLEIGPGEVLAGLNRRNARGVPTLSVGEPEDVDALDVDALGDRGGT
ncbi:MAG: [acyl-carrier-protein] S-malonyltransferase [Gemmatimonadetes bacterium]|nr:[acyl-carrier-protein] S-malonyltransferase [Gemmatimonadota bacterium]